MIQLVRNSLGIICREEQIHLEFHLSYLKLHIGKVHSFGFVLVFIHIVIILLIVVLLFLV